MRKAHKYIKNKTLARGELRARILKMLERGIEEGADIIVTLLLAFTAPYGSSMRGIAYHVEKMRTANQQIYTKERQRLHELLYRLKKDGLVERKRMNSKTMLVTSKKGKVALERLLIILQSALPKKHYTKESDDTLKIFIFDIPESEKRKREWLREALRLLGFKMLQKSVWIGKIKLPHEFIEDLEKLKIQNYVEIFAINRSGSLRRVEVYNRVL